jgi:hypothetical protein
MGSEKVLRVGHSCNIDRHEPTGFFWRWGVVCCLFVIVCDEGDLAHVGQAFQTDWATPSALPVMF